METLLVLPLLLMLLGGLFILGDLLLGRLVQHSMDRTVVWNGGGMVYREELDKTFSSALGLDADAPFGWYGPRLDTSLLPRGYFAKEPSDTSADASSGSQGAPDDEGPFRGNGWIELFNGRADLEIGVPFWVGLLDVQENAVPHPDGSPPERTASIHKLHTETTGMPDPDGRSAVFRRRRRSFNPDYEWYRGHPAVRLVVSDAIADSWPCVGMPSVPQGNGNTAEPYQRNPITVTIGE